MVLYSEKVRLKREKASNSCSEGAVFVFTSRHITGSPHTFVDRKWNRFNGMKNTISKRFTSDSS